MAYDPRDAERVRALLSQRTDVEEKPVVGGGLGFMVAGHLCCAVTPRGLTVRLGREGKADALGHAHVRPHTVGARETSAFVIVEPAGYSDDESLSEWVGRGLAFVATL